MPNQKLKRIQRQELSKFDHGINMAHALIDGMIQNPDEILQGRGTEDLKIYKDILKDDQVHSVFQQRQNAVVNAEWEVTAASESAEDESAAEFIRDQLKVINFDEITKKMLFAIHYGYSIAEIMYKKELVNGYIMIEDILVRDRARFKFGANDELFLHENGTKRRMNKNKFWVHTTGSDTNDNPYGLGIAHALYWPVFFKRNGIKFWLIYLEKFGMPTVQISMPSGQMNDTEKTKIAHDIIDSIQTDSGIIVPEDFVVDLIEGSRSGTADYSALTERMDAAISKIILSQTMTTDSGSSLSQAQVHNDVKMEVIKGDADLLSDTLHKQVINPLIALNFANAKPPTVYRRTEQEEDLVKLAERDNKIASLGFECSEDYVTETYGPGWKKKAEPTVPTGQQAGPMGAEFADVTTLTQQRIKHRQDTQNLIDASEYKSLNFEDIIGDRVNEIKAILDSSETLEDAQARIVDLMEQPASTKLADDIRNATFFSRIMGYFAGQNS
jgi:phage gp29-like protein